MVDKRVICVVLRVDLGCESHTCNNVHGEAAKTSAKTHTHAHASTHSYEVGQREILLIVASVSLYVLLLVDVKGLSWFCINTQVFHQGIAGRVDQRNHLQENERDTDTCQRCQKNSLNQWRVIRNGCWKHLSIHFLSPLIRVSCQLPNVHVKHIFTYFINIKICIFTCSKNIIICKKCRTAVHKSLIKMEH